MIATKHCAEIYVTPMDVCRKRKYTVLRTCPNQCNVFFSSSRETLCVKTDFREPRVKKRHLTIGKKILIGLTILSVIAVVVALVLYFVLSQGKYNYWVPSIICFLIYIMAMTVYYPDVFGNKKCLPAFEAVRACSLGTIVAKIFWSQFRGFIGFSVLS